MTDMPNKAHRIWMGLFSKREKKKARQAKKVSDGCFRLSDRNACIAVTIVGVNELFQVIS